MWSIHGSYFDLIFANFVMCLCQKDSIWTSNASVLLLSVFTWRTINSKPIPWKSVENCPFFQCCQFCLDLSQKWKKFNLVGNTSPSFITHNCVSCVTKLEVWCGRSKYFNPYLYQNLIFPSYSHYLKQFFSKNIAKGKSGETIKSNIIDQT